MATQNFALSLAIMCCGFSLHSADLGCSVVGDTAHHMIPNASLKDLNYKLDNLVRSTDQSMAQKAIEISLLFHVAANKTNREWAAEKQKGGKFIPSLALLEEVPRKDTGNFNMFPMNLVHGPKAQCRTDDVHLGDALDTMIVMGPHANSLCGNALRELGVAILNFLKQSNAEKLESLYQTVRKHRDVLLAYGHERQRFAPVMWSHDPNVDPKDTKIPRYRALPARDDASSQPIEKSRMLSRVTVAPNKCWEPRAFDN